MMEFETWNRDTLIKELKTAMMQASFKSQGDSLKLPITPKLYTDKELHQKTDYELRHIYVQFKKNDDAFRREYEENEENKRFFNQPASIADFDYWSKQAYWSIDEAIALVLGKDPRKVTSENVKPYLPSSPFAKKFLEIQELAKRYVNCKELYDPIFPGVFLAWAERMSIHIPSELKDAVNAAGIQIADWKGHYEKATEQYTQLNKLHTETLELIKIKEKIIDVLNLRISNFEHQEQHNADGFEQNLEQPKADDLKETERQSLYKLVATMAYDGYDYDPAEKKSSLPTELANDVMLTLGEKIDRDTVFKWLKQATDRYPKAIANKTE